jgi:hypothetical protein
MTIQRAICERDICHASVWKVIVLDEWVKRSHVLWGQQKRSTWLAFWTLKTLWKNLRTVGAAENQLDTGSVIFSPDELNCYYSADIVTNQPASLARTPQSETLNFQTVSISTAKLGIRGIRANAIELDSISLKFIKLFLPLIMSPVTHILNTSIITENFSGGMEDIQDCPSG